MKLIPSKLCSLRQAPTLAGLALSASLLGATAMPAAADAALADLVEEVAPSVVTVLASRDARPMPSAAEGLDGSDSPFGGFLRRFGVPEAMPSIPRDGLGSGFILDAEGLVVTNDHVIADADKITVRLADGQEFVATVVGRDPQTDLALLSIDAGIDLPFATLGDSDDIRVGEDVVAVGNPFGLGGTVTSGIVSAKDRSIGSGPYAEFLQTDAAINKGNSGGPLFNMDGEVVGVNSAIFSPTGGSVGVGFAVASNIVEDIVDDLRDDGQVTRGWLGVSIQTVSPKIAEALGQSDAKGALVSEVVPGSPADGAIEVGDIITAFNGDVVRDSRDLPKLVGAAELGATSTIGVLRAGEQVDLEVTIGLREASLSKTDDQLIPEQDPPRLGVTVEPAEDGNGVVVLSVMPGGPAAVSGLQAGDVILRVGQDSVTDVETLKSALSAQDEGAALILIRRGDRQLFLPTDLA